jgi:hypothetical protein
MTMMGMEVYNSTSNNILGLFNWWGESPPNSSQFYGSVVYLDEFESQPEWEGQTRYGQLSKSRTMPGQLYKPGRKYRQSKETDSVQFQR